MDLSFEQAIIDMTWEDVLTTIYSMAEDFLEDIPNNPPPASPPSSRAINTAEQEVYTQPGAAPSNSQHPLRSAAAPALNVGQPAPIVHLSPMQAGFTPADSAAPSPVSHDHSEETMNEMEKVEDIFLMYADEDTQDYCTPAYPPSSPPEPGAHQGPHNVLASNSTSAEYAPPSKASTSISEHAAVEVEVKNSMATLWSFPEDSLPYSPPPSLLPPGESAPRSETSTAVPERAANDVGWERRTATPKYLTSESSASSAPLTVVGPTVNTQSGFTPSDTGAPSVVSKKRKSMNSDESGPHMKKPRNTSVAFQKEVRPRAAATPDISNSVEANNEDVSQRARMQRVAPVQRAEMEPSTSQFVLGLPYAVIPGTTCCIFLQPHVQYYDQYYSQYYDQYYSQYYGQYYCQCYRLIQIDPDNAYYYYHAPTDSFVPRQG